VVVFHIRHSSIVINEALSGERRAFKYLNLLPFRYPVVGGSIPPGGILLLYCLYLLVFFAMSLGCRENCLPLLEAFRFALEVRLYSAELKCRIASVGKYLSPVKEEFLPLLVLHFCLPHFTKEFDFDLEPM